MARRDMLRMNPGVKPSSGISHEKNWLIKSITAFWPINMPRFERKSMAGFYMPFAILA
jgi:hypothetical protein